MATGDKAAYDEGSLSDPDSAPARSARPSTPPRPVPRGSTARRRGYPALRRRSRWARFCAALRAIGRGIGRGWKWVRGRTPATLLVSVSVPFAGVGFAFFVIARDAAVHAAGGIQQINVSAEFVPSRISVVVTPAPSPFKGCVDGCNSVTINGKSLVIPTALNVSVLISASAPEPGPVTLIFFLPSGSWGPNAYPNAEGEVFGNCPANAHLNCNVTPSNNPTIMYVEKPSWVSSSPSGPTADTYTFDTEIPDTGTGLARNPEYLSVVRPQIYDYLTPANENLSNPVGVGEPSVVALYYTRIPDGLSYTWDAGTATVTPEFAGGYEQWVYPAGPVPEISQILDLSASPITDSGINLSVQEEHSYLLLVAGIAFGLASGAWIGALQESSDQKRQQAANK